MENYFNYFTEIEECYRRCRNTPTLLSPLDWALIESWKEAGIPLDAVLIGIERSFVKFQKRPRRIQKINSLAYCTQLVLAAAEEVKAAGSGGTGGVGVGEPSPQPAPFSDPEILDFLCRNAAEVENAARSAAKFGQSVLAEDLSGIAAAVRDLAAKHGGDASQKLQEIEQQLAAMEEKLTASLTRATDVALLAEFRGDVGRGLGPYRRNMSAAQIESLERQFLKKRLFEHYRIPRLSLFYL